MDYFLILRKNITFYYEYYSKYIILENDVICDVTAFLTFFEVWSIVPDSFLVLHEIVQQSLNILLWKFDRIFL